MLTTVKGLVIGRRNAGDSSCFLDILTAEYGVIEVFAHGVKSFKSRNLGSTLLFSYSEFCLKKKGSAYTINSSSPQYNFHQLSKDIASLSLAAYFAEVVRYTSTAEQQDQNLLSLFLIALYELERKRLNYSLIKAVFEFKLAALLGFMPDLRACESCACYSHEEMFFAAETGCIYCGDCFTEQAGITSFVVNSALLHIMRFIIFSPLKKIFKFNTTGKLILELSVISERYLLLHLDRSFKTLNYFYSCVTPPAH